MTTRRFYVDGKLSGQSTQDGEFKFISSEFVLDLIKVDKDGTEHWRVVRESKQDQLVS